MPKKKGRNLGYNEGEGDHLKSHLYKIGKYANKLQKMLHDCDDLPEWIVAKIAVMSHDIGYVKHYLEYKIDKKKYKKN